MLHHVLLSHPLQTVNITKRADVSSSHASSSLPQVLDNDMMLKLERKFLHEVPAELSGLLEPVSDPETRVKLLSNALRANILRYP